MASGNMMFLTDKAADIILKPFDVTLYRKLRGILAINLCALNFAIIRVVLFLIDVVHLNSVC